MPSNIAFVLLDLDGVILDNDQWLPEWERLAESAFVEILGGEVSSWIRHQEETWQRVRVRGFQDYNDEGGLRGLNLARTWDRLHADWIVETCAAVGVAAPKTREGQVDAAERVLTHFYLNTRGVFPGVVEAVSELGNSFDIHMASGNPSWIVQTVLDRLGLQDIVGKPFGSDLLGVRKESQSFYPKIFGEIGANPKDVFVVDDEDDALAAAERAGAKTVKVGKASNRSYGFIVESLSELPQLIS